MYIHTYMQLYATALHLDKLFHSPIYAALRLVQKQAGTEVSHCIRVISIIAQEHYHLLSIWISIGQMKPLLRTYICMYIHTVHTYKHTNIQALKDAGCLFNS